MSEKINVLDLTFVPYISEERIYERLNELASTLNEDYKDKNPLIIAILNGSFIFASDLMKKIEVPSQISFMKVKSYSGTESTGKGKVLLGLGEEVKDRSVLILEDIVDTGNTIQQLLDQIGSLGPKEIKVATLLLKPEALQIDYQPDYVGFEVDNLFLVGYGLDYNGYGRNYPCIYILDED